MIVVTDAGVAGRKIVRTLGMVRGNTVRARHIGHDILAGLKGFIGGEVHEYTKLLSESREHALDRMVEDAESLGATAVIQVRFSTAYVASNMAEILAYGTAVVLDEPAEGAE
ncbi:MAG: heavy metal-binding domain-containing protein [Acidobacteria bacterium]|nr:heavy metal-binding domain-containing protein [Acidobacteriota bacterium]